MMRWVATYGNAGPEFDFNDLVVLVATGMTWSTAAAATIAFPATPGTT